MTTKPRPHDHKPLWLGPDLPPIATCAAHYGEVLAPHAVPVARVVKVVAAK